MGFRSLLWACVLGLLGITVSRGVDLNQGQPKTFNLVLAIRGEEGLREENPAEVIEGIKVSESQEVFEEATRELFEALDRRVALGQLTVLVPLEWKEVAAKNVQIPAEELYADIQLEYNRNGYGDFPWTLQGSLCGSQGTFVSLTPAFVKNPEILAFQECGSRGRLVAMEVIKYHYGVFDERGCSGEGISVVSDPVLINGERGWRTRENRCPGTWTSNRISSSLMQGEFQRLYSGSWATAPVAEKASDRPLCSRKSHDVTLMHAQNVFCGGRSMWEVLETHSTVCVMSREIFVCSRSSADRWLRFLRQWVGGTKGPHYARALTVAELERGLWQRSPANRKRLLILAEDLKLQFTAPWLEGVDCVQLTADVVGDRGWSLAGETGRFQYVCRPSEEALRGLLEHLGIERSEESLDDDGKGMVVETFWTDPSKAPPDWTSILPECFRFCGENVSGWDWKEYVEGLGRESMSPGALGSAVLFFPTVTSTMDVLDVLPFVEELKGAVVVAGVQTCGRGRGANSWISPEGCLMFSFSFSWNSGTDVRRVTVVQHIVSLAMAESVNEVSQRNLAALKWPNDIYARKDERAPPEKIGGVLVKVTNGPDALRIQVGCGLNVRNCAPSVSLLSLLGASDCPSLPLMLGHIMHRLGPMLDQLAVREYGNLVDRYKSLWLHDKQAVVLADGRQAVVQGLDGFGFLTVALNDGSQVLHVTPDGNSFDLMEGLIVTKVRIRYLHAVSGEHTELFQALDDGVVPDLRPNDGIYTLSVTSEKPGPFQFVVEVEGTNVKLNGGLFGGVNSCNSMINSCRPTTLIETNFNVAVASEPQFGTFPIPTPDTLPPPHVTELKIVGRNVELACSYYLSWQAIQSHGAKHFGYHIRCAHSSTSLFSEPCFVAQLPDQGHRAFNNLEYSYEVPPGFCLGSVVCNIRAVSLINGVPGQMTFAAGFCLPPEGVVEEGENDESKMSSMSP
ncbi:unnamed protein product [Cyprideis torosa]|uniref:Uncharacterized protein n=1 Tax=Cyprideis torosa TaxID=163714 RepID=A0A7R8ZMD0_9CRUS|nr:unnamed protein product [Cyprideis torosa]CAG0895281.1 unnamed protein product [Cyprideis torosa]